MDGIKLGVILRAPFGEGDETHQLLQAMHPEHILLHTHFGQKGKKKNARSKRVTNTALSAPIHITNGGNEVSVFVPEGSENVLDSVQSKTVFLEVGDRAMEMIRKAVTKLGSRGHDIQIGIVAPLNVLHGLELEKNGITMFACPTLNGETSLEKALDQIRYVLPGAIPFVYYLSDDDKRQFTQILGRFRNDFAEIVFGDVRIANGIDFQEVTDKKTDNLEQGSADATIQQYRALQPVALRERPERGGNIVGTVTLGNTYDVVGIVQDGRMDIDYGLLSTGQYVVLREGQVNYFEKETIK